MMELPFQSTQEIQAVFDLLTDQCEGIEVDCYCDECRARFTHSFAGCITEELIATYPGVKLSPQVLCLLQFLRAFEYVLAWKREGRKLIISGFEDKREGHDRMLDILEQSPMFAARVRRVRPVLEQSRLPS